MVLSPFPLQRQGALLPDKEGLACKLLPPHPGSSRADDAGRAPFVGAPVLETTDGEFIQDSTVIIEELERRFPERLMVPATPVQRVVASLLGGFGSEGMLTIAMHYRWSYRAEQEHFLQAEFGRAAHHGADRAGRLGRGGPDGLFQRLPAEPG